MSSIRRLISSRMNAAHSTGPRTPAGKQRSARSRQIHENVCHRIYSPQTQKCTNKATLSFPNAADVPDSRFSISVLV